MDVQTFVGVIVSRWWVILVTLVVAVLGSLTYSLQQHPLYQASSTGYLYPSKSVTRPYDVNSVLSLLTTATMAQAFVTMAQSRSLLTEAGKQLGLGPPTIQQYTATAVNLSGRSTIQVSVTGPDAALTARLANALLRRTGAAIDQRFLVVNLAPLDDASVPTSPVRPHPARNALYGGLAGLIAGFLAASYSLRIPRMRALLGPGAQIGEAVRTAEPDQAEDGGVLRTAPDLGVP